MWIKLLILLALLATITEQPTARWLAPGRAELAFVQTDSAADAIITINGNFYGVVTTGAPGEYTVAVPGPGSVDGKHRPRRGAVLCADSRCAAPLPAPPGTVWLPVVQRSP